MKNTFLAALILISFAALSQTADKKNNISAGGGMQSYNGDLGNSWFNPKEEWYGFFHLNYNRYINKSFDAMFFATYGEYGRCRDKEDAAVRADGSAVLNMFTRLATGTLALKYKFANGYLLKENAKIAPYVFLGASAINLNDVWTHCRINAGNYSSVNGGAGFRYNLTEKINFNYTIGFGYFTTDKIDYRSEGRNDMYMQNTFALGFNF